MNNWISVRDRLPEKWCDIIVTFGTGMRGLIYWTPGDSCVQRNITHWMPLPEPPSPPDPFEEWWNSRPNRECMAQLIDKMAANVVWDAALASTRK